MVPDYPGFADYDYDFTKNKDLYPSGSLKAIWNNIRAIDLLESLPCVDRDRIGAIGHSLGGHNALFTAAFEQRIRHVVTSCAFNAFEDYYGGDLKGWSSDRYMPRIASRYQASAEHMPFDFPEVLAALAPRGLFANAPLRDANFAVRGVKTCEQSVRPLYELLGAAADLRFEYPDAEHDFPDAVRAAAYQWLDERLLRK
jgi:predicted dienelactone hydrolase